MSKKKEESGDVCLLKSQIKALFLNKKRHQLKSQEPISAGRLGAEGNIDLAMIEVLIEKYKEIQATLSYVGGCNHIYRKSIYFQRFLHKGGTPCLNKRAVCFWLGV